MHLYQILDNNYKYIVSLNSNLLQERCSIPFLITEEEANDDSIYPKLLS